MSYVRPVVVGVVTGALAAEAGCRALSNVVLSADRIGRNAIGSDRVCAFMDQNCRLIVFPLVAMVSIVAYQAVTYVYDRMHPVKADKVT